MIDVKDIRLKIDLDFGERSPVVYKILEEAISKANYLNAPRIIRSILFLADADVEKLRRNIEVATLDPRDILLWAEYKNLGPNEMPKRIRDFNRPFDQAEKK